MAAEMPEGLKRPRQAAFCLRGLSWWVVLLAVAPFVCAFLFWDPVRPWLLATYVLICVQWPLVWWLRRSAESPGWDRQLRLACRWLGMFIVPDLMSEQRGHLNLMSSNCGTETVKMHGNT